MLYFTLEAFILLPDSIFRWKCKRKRNITAALLVAGLLVPFLTLKLRPSAKNLTNVRYVRHCHHHHLDTLQRSIK